MGYYTRYSLLIEEGDDNLIQEFREESEGADRAFDENGETEDETKWYDHEKELKEFSKKHPTTLFCLHGDGEETGDSWDLYVKNGKCQRCKGVMEYPPYDEKELK